MSSKACLAVMAVSLIAAIGASSVSTSAACNSVGRYYERGCSELVAELLGVGWKSVSL